MAGDWWEHLGAFQYDWSRRFFFCFCPEILVGFLEVKLMEKKKKNGCPLQTVPLGVFISLASSHSSLQQLVPLLLSFPTNCRRQLLLRVSSDSLHVPVSPAPRFAFGLWPQFSDENKMSLWFSVWSTFFVLWGWEWWPPSSLFVGLETGSHVSFSFRRLPLLFSVPRFTQ